MRDKTQRARVRGAGSAVRDKAQRTGEQGGDHSSRGARDASHHKRGAGGGWRDRTTLGARNHHHPTAGVVATVAVAATVTTTVALLAFCRLCRPSRIVRPRQTVVGGGTQRPDIGQPYAVWGRHALRSLRRPFAALVASSRSPRRVVVASSLRSLRAAQDRVERVRMAPHRDAARLQPVEPAERPGRAAPRLRLVRLAPASAARRRQCRRGRRRPRRRGDGGDGGR